MTEILVGTSGWSYPRGRGRWTGAFYPARPAGGRQRFDELAFYARYFDTVEVNSSFYRPPTPDTTAQWVERTGPRFRFSLKLYQKFTHPAMYRAAVGEDAAITNADVEAFRAALDPVAEAGKLAALLAQFPPSFKADARSFDSLARLLDAFARYPIAVELRHRSWSDAAGDVTALLAAHHATWVQIDEPKFRFSIRQDQRTDLPRFSYVRLHGRNAAAWWRHDAAEDRYDYLYTEHELAPIHRSITAGSDPSGRHYVYFNNHFSAKAVVNAVQLRRRLGQPITDPLPDDLIARYPELKVEARERADDAEDPRP